jgi:hypothetical protein
VHLDWFREQFFPHRSGLAIWIDDINKTSVKLSSNPLSMSAVHLAAMLLAKEQHPRLPGAHLFSFGFSEQEVIEIRRSLNLETSTPPTGREPTTPGFWRVRGALPRRDASTTMYGCTQRGPRIAEHR